MNRGKKEIHARTTVKLKTNMKTKECYNTSLAIILLLYYYLLINQTTKYGHFRADIIPKVVLKLCTHYHI